VVGDQSVADSFFDFLEKRSLPPTAAEGLRVGQRIGVQRSACAMLGGER